MIDVRSAARVVEQCEALGRISEEPNLLVRPYGSGAMRRANDTVASWMRDAGMTVRRDAIGNLIGRYEGTGNKTVILGSHLDTVPDAGKYDGILGVMVALACVERLHDRGERLPFAVEVVGFADKEGLRFGTTCLGSSVYVGAFDTELLTHKDPNGVTMADSVRAFGGNPDALSKSARDGTDLLGYFEIHIEQGPVLEKLALPVGVVTGIMGKSTVAIEFLDKSGHAGIFPITERNNALFAAAEFVLMAEETAQKEPGMVATVSQISVYPNAHGVISGAAQLSLDLRHEVDSARERALLSLRDGAEAIAAGRGAAMSWHVHQERPAVPADPKLMALLAQAVEAVGYPVEHMPSGAGHDAAAVAKVMPIAMLFVRCREGISHSPAELIEPEDVAVAIEVTSRFLELLAKAPRR